MLAPFRMVCRDFILPEPASYVFFYAFFNLRNLLYLILSAIAVRMDVSSETEVEAGFDQMMEVYGSCDLVLSNAGIQIVHPFEEYPLEDWKKMMAVHADGAFLVARAAYRRMKASGKGGRIIFLASVQAFWGSKLKAPYNFVKHGVNTRSFFQPSPFHRTIPR